MVGDKFYPADKQTLDKIYDILVGYDDDVYGFIEHMSTLVTAERIEYTWIAARQMFSASIFAWP